MIFFTPGPVESPWRFGLVCCNGSARRWCGDLIESKSTPYGIMLGKDMNSIMTTLVRLLRVSTLTIGLAMVGALSTPLHAQDVKVNIGGGNAEQAKADKELADKLPPG
jgi:hypothetical protein